MACLDPLDLARGSYQRALLIGYARWSGSDLKGRALKYSAHYARSRKNLLARLEAAGFRVRVYDYLNDNSRTMKVLFIDGHPRSSTH